MLHGSFVSFLGDTGYSGLVREKNFRTLWTEIEMGRKSDEGRTGRCADR